MSFSSLWHTAVYTVVETQYSWTVLCVRRPNIAQSEILMQITLIIVLMLRWEVVWWPAIDRFYLCPNHGTKSSILSLTNRIVVQPVTRRDRPITAVNQLLFKLGGRIPALKQSMCLERRGRGAMARASDCLASHACVPVSNPAVPMWGFQRNNIVSPFLLWSR